MLAQAGAFRRQTCHMRCAATAANPGWRQTGEVFAVKVIEKRRVDPKRRDKILESECAALRRLQVTVRSRFQLVSRAARTRPAVAHCSSCPCRCCRSCSYAYSVSRPATAAAAAAAAAAPPAGLSLLLLSLLWCANQAADSSARVQHPNIVGLHEIFDTKDKLYIVMEFISGGEMLEQIVHRGHYSERDAAVLVRQIVNTVKYLHEQGIIHRDLNPGNILLDGNADNVEDCRIKIADFGLVRRALTPVCA